MSALDEGLLVDACWIDHRPAAQDGTVVAWSYEPHNRATVVRYASGREASFHGYTPNDPTNGDSEWSSARSQIAALQRMKVKMWPRVEIQHRIEWLQEHAMGKALQSVRSRTRSTTS